MERAGSQFLAGTGFACNQYGSAPARHQPDDVLELPHLAAASHQYPLPVLAADVGRHSRQVAAPSLFDRLVDQGEGTVTHRQELVDSQMCQLDGIADRGLGISSQDGYAWSSSLDGF